MWRPIHHHYHHHRKFHTSSKFSANYRHFTCAAGVSPATWCTQSLTLRHLLLLSDRHLIHFHSHCSQSILLGSACPQFSAHSLCHCATGCCVDTAEWCGAAGMWVSTCCDLMSSGSRNANCVDREDFAEISHYPVTQKRFPNCNMRTDGRTDGRAGEVNRICLQTFFSNAAKIEDKPHSRRQLEDADSCLSSLVAATQRPTRIRQETANDSCQTK